MCVGGGVSDVGHVAAGASGVVDVFLVLLLSLTLVVVVLFALLFIRCLLYTSPSPRDGLLSRMPSSA